MTIHFLTGFEGCGTTGQCYGILNATVLYSNQGSFLFNATYGFDGSKGIGQGYEALSQRG